jgi:hypothetical protein
MGLPAVVRGFDPPSTKVGGIFSVPLSFGSPRPGVTRHIALRSSDFPPADAREASESGRSSGLLRTFRLYVRLQPDATPESVASELSAISIQPCAISNQQSAISNQQFRDPIRPIPARSDTARASCTDCCGVCRSPRPSSRCSSRSRAAWQPERHARRCP